MLVVEDGSGSPTANTYVSLEYANDRIQTFYPDDSTEWFDKSTGRRETALRIATSFFDVMLRWDSKILDPEQSLAFPRHEFTDVEGRTVSGIPDIIKNMIVDFALEDSKGRLSIDYVKLAREDFADTSDTYASPKIVADSKIVLNAIKTLTYLGYGRRRSNVVAAQRA